VDTKTRVLILHATAGHGHEKAAQAVAEAIAAADPSAIVRVEDSLLFTPAYFGKPYKESYLYFIRKMAWFWGFLYYSADNPFIFFFLRPVRRLVNGFFARKLVALIRDENPDVIVSTHFLSTEVAGTLKKAGKLRARLVTIITDFMPHAFWLHPGVDVYVAAMPETKTELLRRGVPESKIRVLGIPIAGKFSTRPDKTVLRSKVGLDTEGYTVLLTSGGAGVGSSLEIAERLLALPSGVRVAAVCGTNKALYADLSALGVSEKRLKVFGFVNNMNELMGAADVVVGKGGGLTISESLALGRPMIVFEPVPGQETRNAVCLEKRAAGIVARSLDDVIRAVSRLATDPLESSRLATRAAETGKPDAAAKIAELSLRG
jgi:processive 1,2-diacylglycerol beta-glucosyltransferase